MYTSLVWRDFFHRQQVLMGSEIKKACLEGIIIMWNGPKMAPLHPPSPHGYPWRKPLELVKPPLNLVGGAKLVVLLYLNTKNLPGSDH